MIFVQVSHFQSAIFIFKLHLEASFSIKLYAILFSIKYNKLTVTTRRLQALLFHVKNFDG